MHAADASRGSAETLTPMNDQQPDERLHYAAQDGDLDSVKELIEAGCDVNAFDHSLCKTPLHYAAAGEFLDVVELLISAGADVNAHSEADIGETPLGDVAANCSFELAQILIKGGADPTIPGWMGISALHRASKRKKPEGLKVFQMLQKEASNRSKK
jgi:ankyrin repeat protein